MIILMVNGYMTTCGHLEMEIWNAIILTVKDCVILCDGGSIIYKIGVVTLLHGIDLKW